MPDRIRVLFAIGSLAGGGSERQIVNTLRHLDRSQFEPHLYLVSRSGEFLDQTPDDVQITAFDDEPAPSGFYLPGKIRRAQIAHFQSVLTAKEIDVVYDRTPHMTLIAAPACRNASVPHLSTIVSNPADDLSENIGRFRWFKYQLLKRAYRNASRVIANSEPLAKASHDFYRLPGDQTVVLPNGFDFEAIHEYATEEVAQAEVPTDSIHIVTAGRLEECKGFDLLLDAVNELVNARVKTNLVVSIAGRGPQEAHLKELAAHYCLEQVVRFSGFLSNPYPLIQSADLFCLTSRYEGMPNALVEAMSLGVPVLSVDCPHGPREILQDGNLGTLVPALDARAIADGIEQAMSPDSDVAGRAARAKESVLKRYGIAPATRQLEELLARVTHAPS